MTPTRNAALVGVVVLVGCGPKIPPAPVLFPDPFPATILPPIDPGESRPSDCPEGLRMYQNQPLPFPVNADGTAGCRAVLVSPGFAHELDQAQQLYPEAQPAINACVKHANGERQECQSAVASLHLDLVEAEKRTVTIQRRNVVLTVLTGLAGMALGGVIF